MNSASGRLTVMTYNIKNATPDPLHEWPDRLPLLAGVVRRHDPDLLSVQEAFASQLRDLTEALPGFGVIGQGREGGTEGEHAAILFRESRFTIGPSDTFWLSDTPDVPVSNTWDSLFPRVANSVLLTDRATGLSFTILTTHADHEFSAHGDEVRKRSAALIVRRLSDVDGAIIVTGDFNEAAGRGAASTPFADAGFADAWVLAGDPDDTATFNDWEAPAPTGDRIDWIFVKGPVDVERAVIDHAGPETWAASDHFPVIAELRLR